MCANESDADEEISLQGVQEVRYVIKYKFFFRPKKALKVREDLTVTLVLLVSQEREDPLGCRASANQDSLGIRVTQEDQEALESLEFQVRMRYL